jgi:hypothetical protein
VAIHACRVEPVRARGMPEEKPSRRTQKIRGFRKAVKGEGDTGKR